MKIGRLRLLSVFLALAMLCCCIPATLFGAAADGGTAAKATKATLTSMESFVVGGSDRGAVYQIALYLDQEVYIADEANYWRQNLQQNGGGCSETHKERANLIRAHMSINGVTVEDDLKAGTDHTNSTMVATPSEKEKNKLTVTIRKAENHYGLSDTEDFTLQIAAGITLGGVEISEMKLHYNAAAKVFTVVNGSTADTTTAKAIRLSLCSKDKYMLSNTEDVGAIYEIAIQMNREIYTKTGQLTKWYWRNNLQQADSSTDAEHNDRAAQIRSKISINGKTVGDDLQAGGDGADRVHSTLVGISVDYREDIEPKDTLFLRVRKVKNTYGMNPDSEDFTVKIEAGITLGGVEISEMELRYNAADKVFVINNAAAGEPEDDTIAGITGAQLEERDTPCTNGHGDAHWSVVLWMDKDIFPQDGVANFYRNHLTVDGATCSDGKSTVGAALRKLILINGKDLNACIAADEATSQWTAMHVQVGKTGAGKSYLRISVPKTNAYGFDGNAGFSISLKAGIQLNGFTLKPQTVTYTLSAAGTFTLSELAGGTVSPEGATAQKAVFQLKKGVYCSNHTEVPSDHWLVNIYFDKTIRQEFPASSSYWNRHLHASTLQDAICSNILLNGKTLAECLALETGTTHDGEERARNAFNAYHVQTAGSNGEVLQIAIPTDNLYGVDALQSFTVTVKNGITLGGYALNPLVATYTAAATGEFTVTDYTEPEEPQEGLRPVQVKLSEQASGFCTSHGEDGKAIAQWVVDLYYDEPILDDTIAGYYRRHLQQIGKWTSEKTSAAEVLTESILLNGKTLAECYALSTNRTDYAQYLHLQANDDKNHTLRLAIPQDNTYGFNGAADFAIILKKGMRLNGQELAAVKITYTAATGAFTVEKYEETIVYPDPDKAHVTSARLGTAGSSFCQSHDAGEMWLVDLYMDKDIIPGDDDISNSFYWRHLSVNEAVSANGKTTVGGVVRKAILLNGKTLNVCMAESGANPYMAQHIQLQKNSAGDCFLRIAVPKNNGYGFDGTADFEITLRKSLMFNGYEVSPRKITYHADTGAFDIVAFDDPGIETGELHVVKTAVDENGAGIMIWPTSSSKYIDIILDDYLSGTSKNSEALPGAHGQSCRNYILVDGMSVSEWINYGAGDLYQVMVRFENNYIRLLLDGAREPGMAVDEYHWIEFREGLISSANEKIAPAKLYYDPNTRQWTIVDSFEGLNKPWWITNYEEKTAMANGPQPSDPTYQRPQVDWAESLLGTSANDPTQEDHPSVEPGGDTDTDADNDSPAQEPDSDDGGKKQVPVTVRKPRPSKTVYEDYFPVWAIVLIAVGAAAAVAVVVILIVRRKKAKTAPANQ